MINWLDDNKDLLGLTLAVLGLLVTAYTVLIARRSQRRDAFMRIHETLLQPEIQEGRRLLFNISRLEDVPALGTSEYHLINRALAMYDTLGHYVAQGYVSERHVLDVWHHSIRDIRAPAELFIAVRAARHRTSWKPWPYLRKLFDKAAAFRSIEDCCTPPDGG